MSSPSTSARPVPSLSTMWMQQRADHVWSWWQQVRAVGFDRIELSHIVTPDMMEGIAPGQIQVSSVHYPAPTISHPHVKAVAENLLGSGDEALRLWAIEQGRRSIDMAAQYGAKALCIHAGRVDVPSKLEWVLQQRYLAGYLDTHFYNDALQDLLRARAAAAAPVFSNVRRSLETLAEYASAAGVQLGVETRLHIYEIPSLDEAQVLLSDHDPAILGLWFDTGHVQVQANLGMARAEEWLHACQARLVGMHMHDVRGLRDHLIPGIGEIDFSMFAPWLCPDMPCVCEVDWYFQPDELRKGVETLVAAGCCQAIGPGAGQ